MHPDTRTIIARTFLIAGAITNSILVGFSIGLPLDHPWQLPIAVAGIADLALSTAIILLCALIEQSRPPTR